MFDGSSINTLNITSFNTDKVTDISAMFAETPLTEIDLSGFNMENVSDVEDRLHSDNIIAIESFN